jgi:hypothetical protein
MASECSASSCSLDMLTPTTNVAVPARESDITEQVSDSETVVAEDELALGRELMLKAAGERSDGVTEEDDGFTENLPCNEGIPDETGEYVGGDVGLRGWRLTISFPVVSTPRSVSSALGRNLDFIELIIRFWHNHHP